MYICIVKLEEALQVSKFKDSTHKVGLNILYTAWCLKTLSNTVLKVFDLTHEQYNVLRILKGKHPDTMCVKDIAGRMIEKSSNVPRIMDKLALKKMIKRSTSDEDARHTLIQLTPAGILILEEATRQVDAIFNEQIGINEEEAQTLNELLEKMREKL
jgi:DNA-binding MarR family transcriptional regulator